MAMSWEPIKYLVIVMLHRGKLLCVALLDYLCRHGYKITSRLIKYDGII